MIKGEKRSFRPKVGSTCEYQTERVIVLGYIIMKDEFFAIIEFAKRTPLPSLESNKIFAQILVSQTIYNENKKAIVTLDFPKMSNSPYCHGLVRDTDLRYIYSGKQTKVVFKLPKDGKKS